MWQVKEENTLLESKMKKLKVPTRRHTSCGRRFCVRSLAAARRLLSCLTASGISGPWRPSALQPYAATHLLPAYPSATCR